MKNKSRSKVSILCLVRCFIISFLIFSAVSLAIFTYIETNIVKSHVERILSEELKMLSTHEKLFLSELEQSINDVELLKKHITLALEKEESYESIGEQWIMFANCRDGYEQIKLIEPTGQTIINVKNSINGFHIIDEQKLTDESHRNYFSKTSSITANQIYISKMSVVTNGEDLNISQNLIVTISTKIYDSNNQIIGIFAIDCFVENLLDVLDNKYNQHNGDSSLLNKDGYYLKSNQSMFSESKTKFGDTYPLIWTSIANGIEEIENDNDIFIAKKVSLSENVKSNSAILLFDESELVFISHILRRGDSNTGLDDRLTVIISKVIREKWWCFLILQVCALVFSWPIYINKINYHKLKYFSEYDGLTNILNRRSGTHYLEKLIQKSKAYDKNLCICFMDIDELKYVNDRFGHDEGDELIHTIVNCVEKNIGRDDLFIRLGGDEFLIALDSVNAKQGQAIVDSINNDIDLINEIENREYTVRVSSGLVDIKDIDNHDVDYLIKLADMRMYTNKENKDKSNI